MEREDKFNECYQKYSTTIYRIGILYLKNEHDVQDMMQDVFIKYLKYDRDFNSEEDEKWIIRVTINQCKDYLRKFWRKNRHSLEIEIPICDPSYSHVLEEVYKLKTRYRIVIHLYYYYGYSIKEISKLLNVSESTVKQRLKRAREMLKLELEDYYE